MTRFTLLLVLTAICAGCQSAPQEPTGPAPYDETQPLDFTCSVSWEKRSGETWAVLYKEKMPYGAPVVLEVTRGYRTGTTREIYHVAPGEDIHLDGKGQGIVALATTSCQPFRPRS